MRGVTPGRQVFITLDDADVWARERKVCIDMRMKDIAKYSVIHGGEHFTHSGGMTFYPFIGYGLVRHIGEPLSWMGQYSASGVTCIPENLSMDPAKGK
ncbi:MAG: hypothetical protein JST51_12820 [Armatimonadetes bacterium]|nr:hypothetical protein [Armatimonadota bacterium]